MVKDITGKNYIAVNEGGILWMKPGLKENSEPLFDDDLLYTNIFSGCVSFYKAANNGCKLTLHGNELQYSKSDIIAAVPANKLKTAERLLNDRLNIADGGIVMESSVAPRLGRPYIYPGNAPQREP